jgi:hypothetical protein
MNRPEAANGAQRFGPSARPVDLVRPHYVRRMASGPGTGDTRPCAAGHAATGGWRGVSPEHTHLKSA